MELLALISTLISIPTSINNFLYLSTNVLKQKLNPVWDDNIASKFQWVSDYNKLL